MRTLITLLFLCSFLSVGQAQILVDVNATGNNDGSSWADAYTNLQDAFNNADFGSQIWIAAGTYTPAPGPTPDSTRFVTLDVVEIYGGFNGTETMLSERDWETNVTILSGDVEGNDVPGDYFVNRDDNARNVLITSGSLPATIVDGVSIVGGSGRLDEIPADATDFAPWIGAGIFTLGSIEIRNCSFTDNIGSIGGVLFAGFGTVNNLLIDNCAFSNNYSLLGGVRLQSVENLEIVNSSFDNNRAETFGGALVVGNSNATIHNCVFRDNDVTDAIGAGLFIFQNAGSPFASPAIDVRNCSFEGNKAPIGGGIAFNNFFPESQITIDSCTFSENISYLDDGSGYGAAVTLQNLEDGFGGTTPSLAVDIQNSTFEDNEANLCGGLYLSSFSDITNLDVENCSFIGNTADDFGAVGIFNNEVFIGADFSNVLFEDNIVDGFAGALGLFDASEESPMQYTLDSCIFDGNEADEVGGAIWSAAVSPEGGAIGMINNTIFQDNFAVDCCGAIFSSDIDLTIDGSTFEGNSTNAIDPDINGGGAIAINTVANARIQNSIFDDNSSLGEGAAILISGDNNKVYLENSLINANTGDAAITNSDSLWMTNVTILDNEAGLSQTATGFTQLQNTIIANEGDNYLASDTTATLVSMGGNLSSDETMTDFLTGFDAYDDFNNTSPNLGMDFVPLETSVCVDAGNPDGVAIALDLAGAERFQGVTLDIGAFESSFDTPVRELNTLEISVYPNPFVSELQLSNIEGIEQIRLLDAAGRLIQVMPVESVLYVNSEVAQGIYLLEVTIGGQLYFKKLNKR